MLHSQEVTPSQQKSIRVPTSVHHIGKCTVSIFDEEAYRSNIAQYYGEGSPTTASTVKKRPYTPLIRERGNRYNWASSIDLRRDVQASSHMDNRAS